MTVHRRPAGEANIRIPVEWLFVGTPLSPEEARRLVDRALPLRAVTETRNVEDDGSAIKTPEPIRAPASHAR